MKVQKTQKVLTWLPFNVQSALNHIQMGLGTPFQINYPQTRMLSEDGAQP
jgi:hypothetical protein